MLYIPENEIRSIVYKLDMQNVNDADLMDSIDHGELVSKIVLMLAEQLELPEEQKELLYNAAVVHDVGKLKLSRKIYGRDKESMHVEEVRSMQQHARLGAEMLGFCSYPKALVNAVYHHHENYDGSGYPNNLAGEDIPYESRFLKVCDVFAALISDRPYRKGFDKETAIEMMIEDNKIYDLKLFMELMNLVNSPEFDEIMQFAEEINERHKYY